LFYKKLTIKIVVCLLRESGPRLMLTLIDILYHPCLPVDPADIDD